MTSGYDPQEPEGLASPQGSREASSATERERLSILIICDFFYPDLGGVENHIEQLSQGLAARGHRVCILTHPYETPINPRGEVAGDLRNTSATGGRSSSSPGKWRKTLDGGDVIRDHEVVSGRNASEAPTRPPEDGGGDTAAAAPSSYAERIGRKDWILRRGVRYLESGVKVYYAPFATMPRWLTTAVSTFPSGYGFLPLLRSILLREQVDVVHTHQCTSCLALECLFHAHHLGYRTIFTDHSLLEVTKPLMMPVHMNKVIVVALTCADHCIAVSEILRQNVALKGNYPLERLSVIPNAIYCDRFTPEPEDSSAGVGDASTGNGTTAVAKEVPPTTGVAVEKHRAERVRKEKEISGNEHGDGLPVDAARQDVALKQGDDLQERFGEGEISGRVVEVTRSLRVLSPLEKSLTETPKPPPVTIVYMARLTYRKGIDFLATSVPRICRRFGEGRVRFLIGGDGDARPILEKSLRGILLQGARTPQGVAPYSTKREAEIRSKLRRERTWEDVAGEGESGDVGYLQAHTDDVKHQDRAGGTLSQPISATQCQLLGAVPAGEVPSILRQGDIFLNTSLTESFCIALVEAAACGLKVVSTNVGGIPQTLPSYMMRLADPDPMAIFCALEEAILEVEAERRRDAKVVQGGTAEYTRKKDFIPAAVGCREEEDTLGGGSTPTTSDLAGKSRVIVGEDAARGSRDEPSKRRCDFPPEKYAPAVRSHADRERRWAQHAEVRSLYSWPDVCRRTEGVYYRVVDEPRRTTQDLLLDMPQRLGFISGLLYAYMISLEVVLIKLLQAVHPARLVQVVRQSWSDLREIR
ncbi:unnamed protein product [Amoebophrya sp. A25]|nr:unnamed protein product [Amoebophrya sp. A25]|eukprot:GSA25T00000099001.1